MNVTEAAATEGRNGTSFAGDNFHFAPGNSPAADTTDTAARPFFADSAAADEDMVWDADLLSDEDTGPARYALPNELAVARYKPGDSRSLIDSALPLEARIILPAAQTEGDERHRLASYEGALAEIAGHFPLRVARLRDLYERVQAARRALMAIQEREEEARVNQNRRCNAVNEKIDTEIQTLRVWWEQERRLRFEQIQKLKAEQNEREKVLNEEIRTAQNALWEVRKQGATERDEAARDATRDAETAAKQAAEGARAEALVRAEADAIEQAQIAKADRERAERRQAESLERERHREAEAEQRINAARAAAKAAQEALTDAERYAFEQEQQVWEQQEGPLDAARNAHHNALQEAGSQEKARETHLTTRAEETMLSLRQEREARRDTLHEVMEAADAERSRRERLLVDTRQGIATAAARAGLHPGEAEGNLETALRHKFSQEAEAGDVAGTRHLLPEIPSKFKSGILQFMRIAATVVCGMIFGASLGFVTHLIPTSRFEKLLTDHLGATAGLCVLGVFLFWLMGHLVERSSSYASEELNAQAERQERGLSVNTSRRSTWAAFANGAIILLLIGIESTVERYGIVKVATAPSGAFEAPATAISPADNFAYWMIALLVSVPFVLFHAYHGATKVRQRIAEQRRKEHIARCEQEFLRRPEVAALTEAVEKAREAERFLRSFDPTSELSVLEAQRRVAETDAEMNTHPHIIAAQGADDFIAAAARIDRDPQASEAARVLEELLSCAANDPTTDAARREVARLREIAERAAAEATRAGNVWHDLGSAAQAVGTGIVRGVGEGLANALHEMAQGNGDDTENEAGHRFGDSLVQAALHNAAPQAAVITATKIAWDTALALAEAIRQRGEQQAESARRRVFEAETVAEERLEDARGLIRGESQVADPHIIHVRRRLRMVQDEIRHLDRMLKNRTTQLRRQRQSLTLDISQETRRRIQDAHDQLTSAQALWEEELLLLERLVNTPRFLRWFVAWRQTHADHAPTLQRIHAARSFQNSQNSLLLTGNAVPSAGGAVSGQ